MAHVSVTPTALSKIADWNIDDRDVNAVEFVINWNNEKVISVGVLHDYGGELADHTGDYRPDLEIWLEENLPALQEANEVYDEDYSY